MNVKTPADKFTLHGNCYWLGIFNYQIYLPSF